MVIELSARGLGAGHERSVHTARPYSPAHLDEGAVVRECRRIGHPLKPALAGLVCEVEAQLRLPIGPVKLCRTLRANAWSWSRSDSQPAEEGQG